MAHKQEPVIGDGSLHVGDRVVYPNQGICRITGVETKQIAGRDWEVVTLSREEDGATVMVPRGKVMGIGLRKVANVDAIDKVFDELATPSTDPQLDWKVRHRENADRMTGGGLSGTVEVLRELHALSRVRPLPQKERELYDNARHLLVGEIAAAMNIPLHVAEDNLDYALWPPEGMKRKGRALPPATLGPPAAPIRVAGLDDDLGLEEDEEEAPVAPVAAKAVDDEEGEEEPAPAVTKPFAKPPPPKALEKHAPPRQEHAHAPVRHEHAPAKHAAPEKRKTAPAKKAAPAAARKAAARPSAAKKHPAKHAAKKPAAKKKGKK
jgi:RNA polymerase-interacting CarD/CdnL/TRCF family regulator